MYSMQLYYVFISILLFLSFLLYPNRIYTIILLEALLTLFTVYMHLLEVKQYKWWQLKISPDVFDITSWVKENGTQSFYIWSQRQFSTSPLSIFDNMVKKYVKKGHKVLLWVHNDPIGLYAVGEVIENPYTSKIVNDTKYYSVIKNEVEVAQLKIEFKKTFFMNPIDNHNLWSQGLSRYTESLLDLYFNRDLPKKIPYSIGPTLEQQISVASLHGKIDSWSWIPLKSIDLETGNKIESLYLSSFHD